MKPRKRGASSSIPFVQPVGVVQPGAKRLQGAVHQHVVFQNPRHFALPKAESPGVTYQRSVEGRGDACRPVFLQNTEREHANACTQSSIIKDFEPPEREKSPLGRS